jgi:hypothetical protein
MIPVPTQTEAANFPGHYRSLQASSKTTYKGESNGAGEVVRVVWIHHPLYAKWVRLVDLWGGCDGPWAFIELPDGSHTRISASWVDDGESPLPPPSETRTETVLSVSAVRELVDVLEQLYRRVQLP